MINYCVMEDNFHCSKKGKFYGYQEIAAMCKKKYLQLDMSAKQAMIAKGYLGFQNY